MRIQGWIRKGAGLTIAILNLVVSARPGQAQGQAERVFHDAREYTVRIRTQISTPFVEDELGSISGAGFLVDSRRGWVLTNAHVVGHSPADITVAFAGGKFRPARRVYVDPFTDVAILEIQIEDRGHPVAPMDCDRISEVGEAVGVFGHPLGMMFTGTRGIVSGKSDRFLTDFIQIDATVDHGNSGGPVIALRDARVIGIATAGAGRSVADRVNFATPMRDVCRILKLLQAGIPPDPPQLEFSLLVDEDERHTLEVGATHDKIRWPFEAGDRIVRVGRERESVATVTQFVTEMRGRTGVVPIQIVRSGREIEVLCHPNWQRSVVERRAVILDGALIAPYSFQDAIALTEPARLIVHSVEPGSAAESLDMSRLDIIESVDDCRVTDLDSLIAQLRRHEKGAPLRVVFRRISDDANRWYEFHLRSLPGENTEFIEPEQRLVTGTP